MRIFRRYAFFVQWFSEVKSPIARLKRHCLNTPMEREVQKNTKCCFREKEMLLVTKFVFEPSRNSTLLRSFCHEIYLWQWEFKNNFSYILYIMVKFCCTCLVDISRIRNQNLKSHVPCRCFCMHARVRTDPQSNCQANCQSKMSASWRFRAISKTFQIFFKNTFDLSLRCHSSYIIKAEAVKN